MATGEIGFLVVAWLAIFGLLVVLPLLVGQEVARVLAGDSTPIDEQQPSVVADPAGNVATSPKTSVPDGAQQPASIHGDHRTRKQ